jgi:type IV pilus assembly protein PilW
MNVMNTPSARCVRRERGFTLVEVMVAMAIAIFLLGGLAMVMQNVRTANQNEQLLSQLQDQQRFAMTVLTDVIQTGGYYTNTPTPTTQDTALPVNGAWASGQAFLGTHPGGLASDTLQVRYATNGNDGVILCDGSSNLVAGSINQEFINQFTVQAAGPGAPGGLYCQVNNGGAAAAAPQLLVTGVVSMTIWYGVKRNTAIDDYNVDTYVTADQMGPSALGNDWNNVSSVRVQLVFTNPLAAQPGQQPTITFQRVVEVMGRAGVHT